ncbi:MAG: thiamine-phosphate kinase [Planctomycetota bacterium]
MRERELLAHIYERSKALADAHGVRVGPGDDAAVLEPPRHPIAVTVDQLIEGKHFERGTPVDLIARKAVGRSVSDAAAMVARPWTALATAAVPPHFDEANALFDAMARWSRAWGAPIVGGDIASTTGPLTLTVTVLATCETGPGPALRRNAKPGDGVYVTGRLGGSFASGRHLHVVPRVAEAIYLGRTLSDRLGAMIDISDGLGLDGGRVAEASGVAIAIDAERLPLHFDADWRGALADGEDYELMFTARGAVSRIVPGLGTPISRIGEVTAGSGCGVRTPTGETIDASDLGFEHRSGS